MTSATAESTPFLSLLPTGTPALTSALPIQTATPVLIETASPTVTNTPPETAAIVEPSPTLTPSPTLPAPTAASNPSPAPRPIVTSVMIQQVPATPTSTVAQGAVPSTTATVRVEVTPVVEPTSTTVPATPTTAPPTATSAPRRPVTYRTGDVIVNGNFQDGFAASGVANGWNGFGRASGDFGWSDETYPTLLYESQHAQAMRIRTAQYPDAYVGIYQTVSVVDGQPYQLALRGLIRSTEGNPQLSSWGYRLQWGLDPKGGADWKAVHQWIDLGWDDQPIGAPTPTIDAYEDTITPEGNTLTLFIRGWRKWTTPISQGEFIIDAVHLTGPVPTAGSETHLPRTGNDQPVAQ